MTDIKNLDLDQLTKLRHELHSIPETAGNEKETAQKIKSFLKETKPDELITEIGGTGIVARYDGKKDGPGIMLRCELDALPITEENEMDYKSINEGNGHQCGHDGHMAILCGVAKWLAEERPERGLVYLLFQPAEETGQGADWMLQDKKFNKLEPDYIFALHNLPGYEKHQIICRKGIFASASAGFIVRLKGTTSHSAHPEAGNNPAPAVAQLIQLLSSLPQFYTPFAKAAKVSVIQTNLGERSFGISPGKATVMATLRAYDDEIMNQLKKRTEKMTKSVADTYGLALKTEWDELFSPTLNEEHCVSIIEKASQNNGLDFFKKEAPFPWSEDFGRFTQTFPGAMFGLGAGKNHSVLHASDYDFPDEIIETGVMMFAEIVGEVLSSES